MPQAPTYIPTPLEVEQSRALVQQLEGGTLSVVLEGSGGPVHLPEGVSRLLTDLLRQTARGKSVVLLPLEGELSSREAAELLGLSRQFLVDEAEAGKLPHHKVGTHRRFALADVLAYGETLRQSSLEARQELADQSQALDR